MSLFAARNAFFIFVLIGLFSPASAQDKQDRVAPSDPKPKRKLHDNEGANIGHPAPLDNASRDINNLDPTIVPYEGQVPGPLSSKSREIKEGSDGLGPTVFNPVEPLSNESRSMGSSGRAIGSIYQLPNGQLRFVISPVQPLGDASRDEDVLDHYTGADRLGLGLGGRYQEPLGRPSRGEDRTFKGGKRGPDTADGTELVDPPVMTSGSYNQPLGRGSRSLDERQFGSKVSIESLRNTILNISNQLDEMETLDQIAAFNDSSHSPAEQTSSDVENLADDGDGVGPLSGESRGWFKDLTGVSTPEPIRKIAPNGISMRMPEQTSGISVHSPPYIDANGIVWSGTSRSDQSRSRVGQATKRWIGNKQYWVSNYRNSTDRVKPRFIRNAPQQKSNQQYKKAGQQQYPVSQLTPQQKHRQFLMQQRQMQNQLMQQQLQKFQQDMQQLNQNR